MKIEKIPIDRNVITVGEIDSFCFVRMEESGDFYMWVDKFTNLFGDEMARMLHLGTGGMVLMHLQNEAKVIKLDFPENKFMTFGDVRAGDRFCFLTNPCCDYMKIDYGDGSEGCVELQTGKFCTPEASTRIVLCKEPVVWEFAEGSVKNE